MAKGRRSGVSDLTDSTFRDPPRCDHCEVPGNGRVDHRVDHGNEPDLGASERSFATSNRCGQRRGSEAGPDNWCAIMRIFLNVSRFELLLWPDFARSPTSLF